MKRAACLFVLLLCSDARGEIPSFRVAKQVMTQCYGGWNAVVKVTAGADTKYSWSESSTKSINHNENSGSSKSDSITTTALDSTEEFGEEGGDGQYTSTTESFSAENDLSRNLGSSVDEYDNAGWSRSVFAGITLTVPLYSREVRISKQEKRARAVADMADLYAKFDGYEATVQALKKEVEVVRRVMMDTGYQGISNYYGMLTEIEKSKALRISAGRKIMSRLEECGYVEKDRADRKGRSTEKKASPSAKR